MAGVEDLRPQPVAQPVILPTPATPGSIHIRHRFWPDATLLGPHQPRLTERLRILQQFAPSIGKVVLWQGIEIPAETAQTSPIRGRGGHFEEADPIPEYLDPDMRAHDYTVHRSVHVQPVDHAVGYLHLLPVHLHSHLLPEIHLRVAHLDGDRLRPSGQSGRSCIVGNPNAERVPRAIACQLILASSLEAVKFPIERSVMGITENGAHAVTFHATGAALTLRMFQPRIRRAR